MQSNNSDISNAGLLEKQLARNPPKTKEEEMEMKNKYLDKIQQGDSIGGTFHPLGMETHLDDEVLEGEREMGLREENKLIHQK
ncbi:hypothetical protein ABK040_014942 [Willaertia magna]